MPQKPTSENNAKIDENQNTPSVPNSHDATQVTNENKPSDSKMAESENSDENKENDGCDEPSKNMDAVQKILDKINETVELQKNSNEDKMQISKLANQDASDESKPTNESEANKEGSLPGIVPDVKLPCRHCKEVFHSPVDLHQHERYLCKQNRDIQLREQSAEGAAVVNSKLPTTLSPGGLKSNTR